MVEVGIWDYFDTKLRGSSIIADQEIYGLPRHAGDKKSRTRITQNIRAALFSCLTAASLKSSLRMGSRMLLHISAKEWQSHVSHPIMLVDDRLESLKTLIIFTSKQVVLLINPLANRKGNCRSCPDPVDRRLHLTFPRTAQLQNLLLGPMNSPVSIHSHTVRPPALHGLRQPTEVPVVYLATASPCRGLVIVSAEVPALPMFESADNTDNERA